VTVKSTTGNFVLLTNCCRFLQKQRFKKSFICFSLFCFPAKYFNECLHMWLQVQAACHHQKI